MALEKKIDAFKEKALETFFMKKSKNISGLRITTEENRDALPEYFLLSFAINANGKTTYTSLSSTTLALPMEKVFIEIGRTIEDLKNQPPHPLEHEDVEVRLEEEYLYRTGRRIATDTPKFYKAIKKADLTKDIEEIVSDIKVALSEEDAFFQSVEWGYFRNNHKKQFTKKTFCESCEEYKILREEEDDCCDICWECWTRIDNARKNISERTSAAVTYLRTSEKNNPKMEMAAFLEIFHPELSERKKREIVKETKH